MRKLFLFFCCILYSQLYSQTTYVFNVELNDKANAPTFTKSGSVLVYNGTIPAESAFFANYTITGFKQTYPASHVSKTLNYFTFETTSSTLMNNLKTQFPAKYLQTEDLTGRQIQLLSYPDDYGNGVGYVYPGTHLGANISLKSLAYIDCPKAWDFFPGTTPKGNVAIGISDGKVNTGDIDLSPSKVSYLEESSFYYTAFDCTSAGGNSWHGTGVAAIAAAQGNNHHGIAGVCYDCTVLNIPHYTAYNGLVELADAGVKVINMSWTYIQFNGDKDYTIGYIPSEQAIIDELHDRGVVLVAGAGNWGDHFGSTVYGFPASYNHVISVTVVNAQNPNVTDLVDYVTDPVWGPHSHYNEDMVCEVGYLGLDPVNPVFNPWTEWSTTVNSRVDICGPGYAPMYSSLLLGCVDGAGNPSLYGTATSAATPFVTGTVALMQTLNPCIIPDEVEDVIQLTSKNLENKVLNGVAVNAAYIGRSGSGKLETGDAVEFTSEMMNSSGNTLISGQDFWRFDFSLQHINHNLTISDQIFRDENTSDFKAKNAIDLSKDVDLRPTTGYVDLHIDGGLTVCVSSPKNGSSSIQDNEISKINKAVLYPNPNKGMFSIMLSQNDVKNLEVTVFDVIGKPVYQTKVNQNEFQLNVSNLPTGMYLVKLSSNSINETLKFIKE
ncbi:MAG: S8 family serine peptidase [Flavobacterium sp. JAD_PAG50586_2]|nr:MAG: S8 family serine peptidase [Flavobacterium sp. JAD_PAG50586_2]